VSVSISLPVLSGVPPGSVLGSLLFKFMSMMCFRQTYPQVHY